MKGIRLSFMGTNGWFATGTGNTTSALIETPSRYIALDAGDGIRHLDELATDRKKPIDLFISHFHLDHIAGLLIFPKFTSLRSIRIFGQPGTKDILSALLDHPFGPSLAQLKKWGLKVSLQDLEPGRNYMEDYSVECAALAHADTAWGYRFAFPDAEKIIAYCVDTGPCANLSRLARNADALITECSRPSGQTGGEWPHLNPEQAAQAAKKAGCRKQYLTHFAADNYRSRSSRVKALKAAR